ncbi:MAG: glutamine--tRNA ligase, partial [Gemmatimonadetes bacterium]|nr:glutamine--tRNA ligase [Gemmatimonadota bacterium]
SRPAGDWKSDINPESLKVLTSAKLEPSIRQGKPGDLFQFERQGYYCVDPDTTDDKLILNRTITLKDTWAKIAKKKG